VKVEVIAAQDLGEHEWGSWVSWQQGCRGLANPFLSPTFARLAGEVGAAARVAVVRERGRAVGFWPHSVIRSWGAPIVPGYTDLQGMVHAPDYTWDWGVILSQVGLTGARFDHLVADQARYCSGPARFADSPAVLLDGGWAAYADWLRTNRKNLVAKSRQKRRRAQRDHEVGFEADDRSREALSALFALKSAQCRRNGWVDVFGQSRVRRLVEQSARVTGADLRGRVSTLRFDGSVAAVALTLECFGTWCRWISAYDPRFASFSPGLLLTVMGIEQAADDGCRVLSFGKGDEPYKMDFCQDSDSVAQLSVAARGWPGYVFRARQAPGATVVRAFALSPALEGAARGGVRRLRRARYARVGP
jgi:CelD/BcsL family acetyltransferase involved in cellulose biosynthesis